MLTATALAASDGGTVLDLQTDAAHPGSAHAVVLKDGRILHVALDSRLGTAEIASQPPTARPSRRFALAHH